MGLTREEARERGIIGSGNTFNEPSAEGPAENASFEAGGQSAESEVAMDVYGNQSTTIVELVNAAQTDEDPEPGAPDIETQRVPPPLPKETKIAEPDIVPAKSLPPENPPEPSPVTILLLASLAKLAPALPQEISVTFETNACPFEPTVNAAGSPLASP